MAKGHCFGQLNSPGKSRDFAVKNKYSVQTDEIAHYMVLKMVKGVK